MSITERSQIRSKIERRLSGLFCSHCQHMKPDYAKFANAVPANVPIRVFAIEGAKNRELMNRINPMTWKFSVRGYPTIVSYFNGQFYSEYAPDPAKPQTFRKAEDLIEYAQGIGKAPVEVVKS